MDRIKTGVSGIAAAVSRNESIISANLNNVSSLEIYGIKRFFLSAMDTFAWFIPPTTEMQSEELVRQSVASATQSGKKLRRFRDSS
jgi:hypothetical protein